MLLEYIQKAVERAEYKKLDDGTWYAEIPGFEGLGEQQVRGEVQKRADRGPGRVALP